MYNIEERKALLKGISIDNVSGIQTMVDNLNKSPNINLRVVTTTPPEQNTDPVDEVVIKNEAKPLVITPLINSDTKTVNKLSNYIDNLPDKSKRKIIFGLLGVTIILLVIAIIK